ncbi:potassium/proton antiporter [Paenibacillus sp. KQZ6P-2]|uniref:Potassium/proton antiporter n=1 Tax=Paenibacillus mangrovi TaxID=2931978 RepID=A0A9X1WU70_9BACL|nr:potassium/proton antiporter [Paenibacillus mangrovi]MCJ8013975.1 potassium/proton antiporter [Paenibacillus mangrovi]
MESTALVNSLVLLMAGLLLVGVLTTKFSSKFGMPALVLFIVVGMVLNHFIYFDNAFITQIVGILALIVILFEGGMQTKFEDIKPVIGPALSLATVGVLLTTFVVGVVAKYVLDVSWTEGFLFGAIVGSTDAAAVFSVLGGKNIKKRLTSTLEAESGSNDPMAMFLTISLIELFEHPDTSVVKLILSFVWEMGIGLILGLLIGRLAVYVINKINFDSSGLYPVMALGFAVLSYSGTSIIGASGLLAVYVTAIVMGNSELSYGRSIKHFNQGFGWMMQIVMFVLLGLLVFPSELLAIVGPGLLLSLILMLLARPIGVFISTLGMKFSFREKILLSWAGLRGAVPIVLATYPLIAHMEHGRLFFNVVFFVVLTSAIIQGATISPLAEKMGLAGDIKPSNPSLLELTALNKTKSEINHIEVNTSMAIAGREIAELNLPEGILFTAIIRNEQIIAPHGNTKIEAGDTLYMLSPKAKRQQLKAILTSPVRPVVHLTGEKQSADGRDDNR